jgi:phosphate-selective porin OprO/OprP
VRRVAFVATLTVAIACVTPANAQDPAAPPTGPQPQALDDTIEAGEADAEDPVRRMVNWNEFDGRFFTIRVGAGVLYEYAGYSQDDNSKEQLSLTPDDKVRDVRVLLKGATLVQTSGDLELRADVRRAVE